MFLHQTKRNTSLFCNLQFISTCQNARQEVTRSNVYVIIKGSNARLLLSPLLIISEKFLNVSTLFSTDETLGLKTFIITVECNLKVVVYLFSSSLQKVWEKENSMGFCPENHHLCSFGTRNIHFLLPGWTIIPVINTFSQAVEEPLGIKGRNNNGWTRTCRDNDREL